MKILLIAFRAIGDMVLITPILRLLKISSPHVELTVVVDAISYEVLLHNPHIEQLIVIDRNKNRGISFLKRMQRELKLISDLRSKRFDVAVGLFEGPRTAIMSRLSGARLCYGEKGKKNLFCRLYTHKIHVSRESEHLIKQKLKIIQPIIDNYGDDFSLELFLTREEEERGLECLKRSGIKQEDVVVGLFPGAGWEHKQWPAKKFSEIGDQLATKAGVKIILIGGVRDRKACLEVLSMMSNTPVMLIQKTVRETMSILSRISLFISNDTGPMHIASAMRIPTIGLFGPSNIIKYRPWGENTCVISAGLSCSPCPQQIDTCYKAGREKQECMKQIEVDEVYQTAIDFLGIKS